VSLDDFLKRLTALDPETKAAAAQKALDQVRQRFIPNPGPQTDAWFSKADELFFGGGAGGGKTALLCGLAIEAHAASIIFRREFAQTKGLVKEVQRQLGSRSGYNGQDKLWRLPGGNELEIGSVQHEDDKDKYQGRAHDFKGFDEITHFTESQYRFLIGWLRSTTIAQRCRVVATGNPPLTAEGQWVIRYWGAWLDPTHPNPARPGELRWYAVVDGEDREVDGPGPHVIDGKEYLARSRTFIPAKLEDNPDLMSTGYAAVIEGMPEPMRTMMREGRFDVGLQDQAYQVIPTAWILAAQGRWKDDGFKTFAMTAMALDPAGGGRDSAELCWRHGGWYAPLVSAKGPDTADGSASAATVVRHRRDNAPVVVDAGGGYGGAAGLRLKDNGIAVVQFNGAAAAMGRTRDGTLRFVNKRAEAWWRMREELDPDQEGGSAIALPPDPELRADLAAPTYEVRANGILIESKDHLRERLGRSPGKGDAVVMCLSEGNAAVRKLLRRDGSRHPKVNIGYAKLKKRYAR
jgi:Terminase large subunit, T4likevirus-type, N-terminal